MSQPMYNAMKALLLSLILIPASAQASEVSYKSLEKERLQDMAVDHSQFIPERRDERGELKLNDSNIAQYNDTNFQHLVLESSDTFVIGMTASWCDPCKMVFPAILETVYGDLNHEITVATMDVDVSPQTTENYGIRNIPTVLIFKAGKFVGMHEYPDIYDLRSWIDGVLKGQTEKGAVRFQKR
jgi:thioredoxin 1